MNLVEATSKAFQLCEAHNAKLLYLVVDGSHLYGTDRPGSDLDIKGIFLPSLESLVWGQVLKPITWSTKKGVEKNSSHDVDIELLSLQHWLQLVHKGDTLGLDLLFSYTYGACLLIKHCIMDTLFNNIDKLLTSSELVHCAGVNFAIGQAKKYGAKGKRLGVLRQVYEYIDDVLFNLGYFSSLEVLSTQIDNIVNLFGDKSLCYKVETNGVESLVICGKTHRGSIRLTEFHRRVFDAVETYGERAKLASINEGIDWKAVSHAIRALRQTEELFTTGMIQFPLGCAQEILHVKQGKTPWIEVEALITQGLDNLSTLSKNTALTWAWDQEFVDLELLKAYGLR